jgi:hypothetical protein
LRGGAFYGMWHEWWSEQACEKHFVRTVVMGGAVRPSMALGMDGGIGRLARNTLFVRWCKAARQGRGLQWHSAWMVV